MTNVQGKKVPSETALLVEYQEIGNNLRHYANLQFAQMSIFVAIAGGVVAGVTTEQLAGEVAIRWALCIAGATIGVLFALMSLRVNDYWDKHVQRARGIEVELGLDHIRSDRDLGPASRIALQSCFSTCLSSLLLCLWRTLGGSQSKAPSFSAP